MLQQAITDAVAAIPVPPTLEAEILAACRRAALTPVKPSVSRYVPAVATAAACVAVLGVSLLSVGTPGGNLPTQPTATPSPSATLHPHNTTTPSSSATTGSTATTTVSTTTAAQGESTTVTTQPKPSNTGVTPQSTTAAIGTKPTMGGSMQLGLIQYLSGVSDYETMTDTELEAYYGRRILPTYIPDGLERRLTDGGDRGIFRRNEEKIRENPAVWSDVLKKGVAKDAPVVFDRTLVTYSDFIDGRRELTVGVSTAPYPRYNLGMARFDETLTVAGVTVNLRRYDDNPYSAEWNYTALAVVGEVEYLVDAWNIPEEEFLAILTSLLE